MRYVVWACLRAEWVQTRHYWLNTLSAVGFMLLLFLMLFFGMRAFGSPQADLSALVVGYYAFSLTNVAFQRLAAFLLVESQTGTLEQLALSPFGLWRVALAHMLAYLLSGAIFAGVALIITMAITGVWLRIHPIGFPVMTLLLVGQAYAFGLAMGGLALRFKRVGDLMQLVTMMLAVFILTPATGAWAYLLPLGQSWRLLQEWLQTGALAQPALLAAEVGKTVVLLMLGWLVYWLCERQARQRGLLGRYA
ncbi:MAG: ABC transporter permease [Fimbriimonadales bacterium]|nr:ABC transporter permease [Fimbriimonadales bacterium]